MVSKRQFINRSMRNWDPSDAHDSTPKARIQRILRDMGIYVIFDETIFVSKDDGDYTYSTIQPKASSKEEIFKKYHVFKPDILSIKSKLIVELDGDFHRNTKKGVRQTSNRNDVYSQMRDIHFLPLVTHELKDMSDMDIRKLILALY